MSEPQGLVGRSLPRVEDRRLLTGAGEFVDDIALPGLLQAAFVRSPLARARIAGLDLNAVRAAPGVVGAFAADDLDVGPLVTPCEAPDSFTPARPLLATGEARFVGEPLAVVVAESRYAAEDAAELAGLDLEPLEPATDPLLALADGAPAVHGDGPNRYLDSRIEAGEVDEAFARAAVVVERTFRHERVSALPIEPRALVAAPDGDGVRLWVSTQGPHAIRVAAADVLGLPQERIRVACADVGGGFGLKAHVYPEEILLAWLALRLGRPVKWIEDRSENLVAASHARDQHLRVRAAADADGRLLALDVEQVVDQGAYGAHPHGIGLEANTTSALLPGPYRLPAYRVRARAVATNKCPQGAYRGVGFVVAVWVHERTMDALAAELGLDRAEIRRRNLIGPEELPATTLSHQRYDSGDYPRALELALEAAGWTGFEEERRRARLEGRLLGFGLSCYVEPTGMSSRVFQARGMAGIAGYDSAHVALDGSGAATVWLTTPTIGQGTETTFVQLAAESLGLAPASVRVARSDTGVGDLAGTGTFASRSAFVGGGALATAGAELRRRLLEDAAERLEASAGDLEIVDGVVRVAGSPEAAVTVEALAGDADPGRYAVSERYDPPAAAAYPYGVHACVVSVDPETGEASIVRYAVVEDCGVEINPMIVEGQAHGAVAQGIGEALYETVVYDGDGQPLTGSLADYLVPTAVEIPSLLLERFETPPPDGAWGVKGVGESGTVGSPAAVANAVADAVGGELNELPLPPERVLSALAAATARAIAPAAR